MRISMVWLQFTIFVLCCFLLSFQIWTLYDLTTAKDVEIQQHPKSSYHDICKLANDLDVESQHYSSYQLGLQWSNVRHVTKSLCRRSLSRSYDAVVHNQHRVKNETTSFILTFKVARSGSTFFSDVIKRSLQAINRTAYLNWEPYGRVGCYQRKSPELMESELSTILSSNCTGTNTTIDPPLCDTPGTHRRCCPVPKCWKRFNYNAISVVSLNPRFLDTVRWERILSQSFPRISIGRVFNLRRTNLVKLAYSKYHHDGCPAIHKDGKLANDCKPEKDSITPFSFDCLLQCVQHYGIGDQEFSSSVAYRAVENTAMQQPFLVLYEDVMRDQLHASEQIFNYVGVKIEEGDNFFQNTKQTKLHGDDMCKHEDVNCNDWNVKLKKDYPCLFKQLYSSNTVAWSVPIETTSGKAKLSIQGDCHRLQNLDFKKRRYRHYEELYK